MKLVLVAAREVPPALHVLFVTGFAVVLVWFAACAWLIFQLKSRHPSVYQQLGLPNLFTKLDSGWKLVKFLFSAQPGGLEDYNISRTVTFMRVWIACYLVFLASLVIYAFVVIK